MFVGETNSFVGNYERLATAHFQNQLIFIAIIYFILKRIFWYKNVHFVTYIHVSIKDSDSSN